MTRILFFGRLRHVAGPDLDAPLDANLITVGDLRGWLTVRQLQYKCDVPQAAGAPGRFGLQSPCRFRARSTGARADPFSLSRRRRGADAQSAHPRALCRQTQPDAAVK